MSLGSTVMDALRIADELKAAGLSEPERQASIEKTLRDAWPFAREWKFLCENCRDYGLEMSTCPGDATCGRHKAHLPHDFGRACWCQVGQKFRKKERTETDLVDAAAKTSKPMTRVGRR